jgi:hypothetical protein
VRGILIGAAGNRGWGSWDRPRPRQTRRGSVSPVLFPTEQQLQPSPSPNRGIPRGESGIGSPLPSLRARQRGCEGTSEGRRRVERRRAAASCEIGDWNTERWSGPVCLLPCSSLHFTCWAASWARKLKIRSLDIWAATRAAAWVALALRLPLPLL